MASTDHVLRGGDPADRARARVDATGGHTLAPVRSHRAPWEAAEDGDAPPAPPRCPGCRRASLGRALGGGAAGVTP